MKKLAGRLKVHLKDHDKRRKLIVGSVVFLCGFAFASALAVFTAPQYATGEEIEAARTTIAEQFINENTVACTDSSDPISPTGRIVVFYRYLRVNRYADRAVIRGCNNIDSLLAKAKDGKWVKTKVNISLDVRANRRWQNVCNIADITVADEEDRPENASIDEENYKECLKLREL